MSWVNYDIVIDFPLPKDIEWMAKKCEELDREENYAYDNFADTLDIMCKEAYRMGHITQDQWDIIERRYIYG